MPEKETLERAEEDKREGKAPSTQAGEFVKEEMDHIREGKHGAASTKQAIAIGLSKARTRWSGSATAEEGAHLGEDAQVGGERLSQGTQQRAQEEAVEQAFASDRECALKRQPHKAASKKALSRQAKQAANRRGSASRKKAAQKAVRTKGAAGRKRAAKKAAATRMKKAA